MRLIKREAGSGGPTCVPSKTLSAFLMQSTRLSRNAHPPQRAPAIDLSSPHSACPSPCAQGRTHTHPALIADSNSHGRDGGGGEKLIHMEMYVNQVPDWNHQLFPQHSFSCVRVRGEKWRGSCRGEGEGGERRKEGDIGAWRRWSVNSPFPFISRCLSVPESRPEMTTSPSPPSSSTGCSWGANASRRFLCHPHTC